MLLVSVTIKSKVVLREPLLDVFSLEISGVYGWPAPYGGKRERLATANPSRAGIKLDTLLSMK